MLHGGMPGGIGTGIVTMSISISIGISITTEISTVIGTRNSMEAEKASGSTTRSTGKEFHTAIIKQRSNSTGHPQKMPSGPVKIFAARQRPVERTLRAMALDSPGPVIQVPGQPQRQGTGQRPVIQVSGQALKRGTGHRLVIKVPGRPQRQGTGCKVVILSRAVIQFPDRSQRPGTGRRVGVVLKVRTAAVP